MLNFHMLKEQIFEELIEEAVKTHHRGHRVTQRRF